VHRATRFVLVSPHYPENVGAACRALKVMGFGRLGLVRPGRLAGPDHPMARKMAVRSEDVLGAAELYDNLAEAVVGADVVIGTSGRTGVRGVLTPEHVAARVVSLAALGRSACFVFGNEKSGLTSAELARCDVLLRIPMAAPQPSINLAQAVQVVSYVLLREALDARARAPLAEEPEK
jgi:tRNA/rRNA methyltransferase